MNNDECKKISDTKLYRLTILFYPFVSPFFIILFEMCIAINYFLFCFAVAAFFIAPSWVFSMIFLRNYPLIGIGLVLLSAAYLIYIHISIYRDKTDR